MGILNPKPRFGLDTDSGRIYDYIDKVEVPVSASYHAADGHWNLIKVRDLIGMDQPVESARIDTIARPILKKPAPLKPATPVAGPAPTAAVLSHPMTAPADEEEGKSKAPLNVPALTSVDIQALGLSAGQKAAMGITPQMATVSGITAEQKAHMQVSPARAKFLGLTPEQAKAFA